MILVTGAAGKTGKAIIRALARRRVATHAFVHREAHVAAMTALGATAASVGSLDDGAALLRAAEGAAAIYHICPNVSPYEVRFAEAAAAAARKAGVPRLVYHSVLHPQIEAMPHHWQKMRAEEMLFESGLGVTVLQPAAYMQNILASLPGIAATGVYRVPYPAESRISLVDLDDVAEAAAIVLTSDKHIGATYEVVGTSPLSQTDVAETLSAVLARPVAVEAETPDAWSVRAQAAGMDDDQRDTLVKMFRYYAAHGLAGNANTLRWLLEREPTSLTAAAQRDLNR